MRTMWRYVILVLGLVLLGTSALSKASLQDIQICNRGDMLSQFGGHCTTECLPYTDALKQIEDRIKDGKSCDCRPSAIKEAYWRKVEKNLFQNFSCIVYWRLRPTQPAKLCVTSGMVIALTNAVGTHCIPGFHDRGMWKPPSSDQTGVLACQKPTISKNTPQKTVSIKQAVSDAPGLAALGTKENSAGASRMGLECEDASVHPICGTHVWRKPVNMRGGDCTEVCVSSFCSQDFTFNYCFNLTRAFGITRPVCTANTITRQLCFG